MRSANGGQLGGWLLCPEPVPALDTVQESTGLEDWRWWDDLCSVTE